MNCDNMASTWCYPPSEETPEELRNISAKDRGILMSPLHFTFPWSEVRDHIRKKQFEQLRRTPTDLRRYLRFCWLIKQEHGTMINYIAKERLKWELPIKQLHFPFTKPEDIKILRNDWPYDIDKNIVHLVVWTKFELLDDLDITEKPTGMYPESLPSNKIKRERALEGIQDFVNETFGKHLGKDNVIPHPTP